ncbi:hypothetical protein Egran_04858 [Elaphomyces granulatus]|uniref:Telomere-associated protein Rif1 N-terminal domain-containing protein n=1 Tax=Elaphomyces granulatus TaxID=519963 RepID=A0A232LT68_9EURO|nr:hypothetical protein Egran_04858 [Elaphomyces granulatus]
MVEVLSTFPTRPPTPPRASSHVFLHGDSDRALDSQPFLHTPDDSPPSTNGSVNARSGERSKRVNFSPWTKYIKAPSFPSSSLPGKAELRTLPRSKQCKPSKSILKPSNSPLPSSLLASGHPLTAESFAMLLKSITQQLAGESLSSRLDAYMHLLGALKAYEGLPQEQALSGNLGLLTQFIQRDICRDLIENHGPLEVNLVIHALKLAIVFVWDSSLSPQLSDDFRSFIMDKSVNCLQEVRVPKSVLIHYMHLLSTQNFSPKIMTNGRVARILSALSDVTDRVNGNGIISHRLIIYQRLLNQSKPTMANHSTLWVKPLVSGLLHHIKDTRAKAISLGIQASLALGPNANVSSTVRDIFDKPLDQGRRLVSEICERMSRMMSSTESGVHVPQIWSVVVLLLRSKRVNINQWGHFKEWVLVLQKCFNCSEPAVKAQAVVAWNRFVYAINLNESTSLSMIRMLTKPIMSQLDRKKHGKAGSSTTQIALSSYYNLLYYAFRPSSSYQHLDVIWEEYVAQPFTGLFLSTPNLINSACQALSSLLRSSQAKVWTENKVIETSRLEPEDLLALDCKWVRSRIASVLKVFETLLKLPVWTDGAVHESNIAPTWKCLLSALSEASSKEVKPSTELMQAVACLLGLLQRLWNGGPPSLSAFGDDAIDVFFNRFGFLLTSIMATLGALPFTEKLLLKTGQETFQMANTPTHRRAPADINLDTPLMHLLRLVSVFPKLTTPTTAYFRLVDGILEAASKGRQSRGSRLDLFEKCCDLCPLDSETYLPSPSNFAPFIWEATATLTGECLRSVQTEAVKDHDGSLTYDYDKVTKILHRGARYRHVDSKWSQLLEAFVRVVRIERGERAVAGVIIEPLADVLKQLDLNQILLPSTALLRQSLSSPFYQRVGVNSTAERFAHQPFVPNQTDESFPPHKLLQLVGRVLSESYQGLNSTETVVMTEFIETLTSFFRDHSLDSRSLFLEKLQTSLALWLRDDARQLCLERNEDSQILTACRLLAIAIATLLQSAVPHDTPNLKKFEVIISAGLESSRQSTANKFIELWNCSFGFQDALEYPSTVLSALRRLKPFVELKLPSLPLSISEADLAVPELIDSQNKDISQDILNRRHYGAQGDTRLAELTRPKSLSSSPITSALESGIAKLLPKPVDSTPKRGPRHNNSQIQFLAVESSPSNTSYLDSQLLTEHQKEVQERQRNETPLFLEVFRRSTPDRSNQVKDLNFAASLQLPDLHRPEPTTDVPLTPTLAMGLPDNEDLFFGSSPTPGSKGHTHKDESRLPFLTKQTLQAYEPSDPPSSPPVVGLSLQKRRRPLHLSSPSLPGDSDLKGTGESEAGPLQGEGIGKCITSAVIIPPVQGNGEKFNGCEGDEKGIQTSRIPGELSGSHSLKDENFIISIPHKSTSVQFTEDYNENSETAITEQAPVGVEVLIESPGRPDSDNSAPDQMIIDSCSDDLELQIASQLEQDLGLALDFSDETNTRPLDNAPRNSPVTRKRKRKTTESPTHDGSKRRSLGNNSIITRAAAMDRPLESSLTETRNYRFDTSSSQEDTAFFSIQTPSKRRAISNGEGIGVGESGLTRKNRLPGDTTDKGLVPSTTDNDNSLRKKRRSPKAKSKVTPRISRVTRPVTKKSIPTKYVLMSEESQSRESSRSPEGNKLSKASRKQGITNHKVIDAQPFESDDREIMSTRIQPPESNATQDGFSTQTGETCLNTGGEASGDGIVKSCACHSALSGHIAGDPAITGEGILHSLRSILDKIRKATFGRDTLREIDDVMFDIRVASYDAAKLGH